MSPIDLTELNITPPYTPEPLNWTLNPTQPWTQLNLTEPIWSCNEDHYYGDHHYNKPVSGVAFLTNLTRPSWHENYSDSGVGDPDGAERKRPPSPLSLRLSYHSGPTNESPHKSAMFNVGGKITVGITQPRELDRVHIFGKDCFRARFRVELNWVQGLVKLGSGFS